MNPELAQAAGEANVRSGFYSFDVSALDFPTHPDYPLQPEYRMLEVSHLGVREIDNDE